MRTLTRLSPHYGKAIEFAIAQQFIALAATALLLDGGTLLRLSVFVTAAHWASIVTVVCRRPSSPTRFDLVLIGFGFIPVAAIACAIARLLGRTI